MSVSTISWKFRNMVDITPLGLGMVLYDLNVAGIRHLSTRTYYRSDYMTTKQITRDILLQHLNGMFQGFLSINPHNYLFVEALRQCLLSFIYLPHSFRLAQTINHLSVPWTLLFLLKSIHFCDYLLVPFCSCSLTRGSRQSNLLSKHQYPGWLLLGLNMLRVRQGNTTKGNSTDLLLTFC